MPGLVILTWFSRGGDDDYLPTYYTSGNYAGTVETFDGSEGYLDMQQVVPPDDRNIGSTDSKFVYPTEGR